VGYAFQIYFDFSGYSDMASGLALMLGFVLIQNFDSPYQAESITDFWRRWHISLSTWLRDYLYIPLGGNRRGRIRTYVNLMVVMLLGGLWHGASWNFVIWGAIHGAMLAFDRIHSKEGPYARLPRPWRVAITFGVVCITWVFFRAETLPQAANYLASLFGLARTTVASDAVAASMYTNYHILIFLLAGTLVWRAPCSWVFSRRITWVRSAYAAVVFMVSVAFMWTQSENPFIYFQF
jgi:alginate O-acetyltransferase complex protein AlgI